MAYAGSGSGDCIKYTAPDVSNWPKVEFEDDRRFPYGLRALSVIPAWYPMETRIVNELMEFQYRVAMIAMVPR